MKKDYWKSKFWSKSKSIESDEFIELPRRFKKLNERKNSNSEWRQYQKRNQHHKKTQQQKHEIKVLKECNRIHCMMSHKSIWIFRRNTSKVDWNNLIKKHLFLKKIHFEEKKYWIEDEDYISSTLRNKTKQFAKKYANCKSHAKNL